MALIVYDKNGKVWGISYGEINDPVGVPFIRAEIPEDATVLSVDTKKKEPIFGYRTLDDISTEELVNRVKSGELEIREIPINRRTEVKILIGGQ